MGLSNLSAPTLELSELKRLFLPLVLSIVMPIFIGAAYLRRINDLSLKGKDVANYTRRIPLGIVRGTLLDRKGRPLTMPGVRWKVIQFNLRREIEEADLKGLRILLGKKFRVKPYRYLGFRDIKGLSQEDVYEVMKHRTFFRSIEVVPTVNHRLVCKECFHTVGRTTSDGEGLFGLEKLYNRHLKGELGHVVLKVDARGNLIDEPKVLIYQNPTNVRTYLDLTGEGRPSPSIRRRGRCT